MASLDVLCEERRCIEIADVLGKYYGVFVKSVDVERWFQGASACLGKHPESVFSKWSSASWLSWLRNRMEDSNYFLRPFASGTAQEDHVVGIFHIGFINLVETPEQRARLPEGSERAASKTARSKIGRTVEVVSPIDRLAAVVAPVEKCK